MSRAGEQTQLQKIFIHSLDSSQFTAQMLPVALLWRSVLLDIVSAQVLLDYAAFRCSSQAFLSRRSELAPLPGHVRRSSSKQPPRYSHQASYFREPKSYIHQWMGPWIHSLYAWSGGITPSLWGSLWSSLKLIHSPSFLSKWLYWHLYTYAHLFLPYSLVLLSYPNF